MLSSMVASKVSTQFFSSAISEAMDILLSTNLAQNRAPAKNTVRNLLLHQVCQTGDFLFWHVDFVVRDQFIN